MFVGILVGRNRHISLFTHWLVAGPI